MSQSKEDIISLVIDVFNQSFSEIGDRPVCIAIIDADGLSLVTAGYCHDLTLLEAQFSAAVGVFESLNERFKASFKETLTLITLEFEKQAIYIDDLRNTGADLYLVAHSSSSTLLMRARPFLTSIAEKIERLFSLSESGELTD